MRAAVIRDSWLVAILWPDRAPSYHPTTGEALRPLLEGREAALRVGVREAATGSRECWLTYVRALRLEELGYVVRVDEAEG